MKKKGVTHNTELAEGAMPPPFLVYADDAKKDGVAPFTRRTHRGESAPLASERGGQCPSARRRCRIVILVPTRELALQTSQVCKELGKHLKIQVMATTGGTSLKDDIMRLYQPVHLLVGTPGRILDLTKKGVCILKDCSMLIMDEICLPGELIFKLSML